jgi:hypothetical protein
MRDADPLSTGSGFEPDERIARAELARWCVAEPIVRCQVVAMLKAIVRDVAARGQPCLPSERSVTNTGTSVSRVGPGADGRPAPLSLSLVVRRCVVAEQPAGQGIVPELAIRWCE